MGTGRLKDSQCEEEPGAGCGLGSFGRGMGAFPVAAYHPEPILGSPFPPAQAWKNATVAEQAKLPATDKPVLLSKDIEAKMMALDREVQYLLNKAKFAKPRPRPKDKNGTRAEPPLNSSDSEQGEKVIPPAGEGRGLLPGSAGREGLSPSWAYIVCFPCRPG